MLSLLKRSYYCVKPLVPESLNISLRRKYLNYLRSRCGDIWPIDRGAGFTPPGWKGWPEGKRFAVVLTHDVEGDAGLKKCRQLLELEMELGFRSCFNFVAKDYRQDHTLMQHLVDNGFEIGLHGLKHRGNLFATRKAFLDQRPVINKQLKDWNAVGFRAPSMYHNLEWIHELELEYDCSTFDTDPFEPQPDGIGTIFPCWIHNGQPDKGYVELPYTLPQDFALFILMQEKDDRIWREKLDWIVQCGGMALLIVHPDYMSFNGNKPAINEFPASYYRDFLTYIKEKYENQYYHVLPKEMARFWVENYCPKNEAVLKNIVKVEQTKSKPKVRNKLTLIDPVSDPRWDKFVENHPNGWITHHSGWKTVLENSFPHMNGYYFALTEEGSKEIKAALPVFDVNSWLLGRRLISIPFATLSDPLIDTQEDMQELITEVISLSNKLRATHLEIRSFKSFPLIQDTRFQCSNFYKHHYLSLTREIEEIKKTFHRTNVRQRIQRAEKSNITVKVAESEAELIEFYNLHKRRRKDLRLPSQPYIFFKQIWDIFQPFKYITLLLAYKDGQIIAGLLLFKFKGRVSAEILATDTKYLDLSPNHLLFWEAMKAGHSEGFKIFDFGRTSPLNTSLMQFKDRWGTTVVDLPQFVYPGSAQEVVTDRETSASYRVSRILCERAPEPFYSMVGNFLYRHLG